MNSLDLAIETLEEKLQTAKAFQAHQKDEKEAARYNLLISSFEEALKVLSEENHRRHSQLVDTLIGK